jgi:hypothetical protein
VKHTQQSTNKDRQTDEVTTNRRMKDRKLGRNDAQKLEDWSWKANASLSFKSPGE